jgi:DNA-binding winged helix-turn-helix (wHTH) protein/TolB-like protein
VPASLPTYPDRHLAYNQTVPGAPVHEFGPFRYDAAQRQLFRDNQPVALVPKAIDTLHALLERRGQIVEKADLLKLVWPDTTVEEIGLARNISILRKALGDEGDAPRYIETIPRRGYRFTAQEPEPPKPAPARPRPRLWIAAAGLALLAAFVWWQFYLPSRYLPPGERMAQIAVLPFEVLTPASVQPAAIPTLNELVVASLVQRGGMRVISPTTVRRYQRFGIPSAVMARVLGLDVILEGTLQQANGQIRITARLADVHSGKLIWAETYALSAAEPETAYLEAAQGVAAAVSARLVLAKP